MMEIMMETAGKSFNDLTSKFLVCFEQLTETLYVRACLKNHSRNLHAPLCGIFCPNSVAVARYAPHPDKISHKL